MTEAVSVGLQLQSHVACTHVHTRATETSACGAEEKWNGRLLDSVGVGHGSDPFHQPIRRDEGANAVAGRR
jgi:hypothetical protein